MTKFVVIVTTLSAVMINALMCRAWWLTWFYCDVMVMRRMVSMMKIIVMVIMMRIMNPVNRTIRRKFIRMLTQNCHWNGDKEVITS